MKEILKELCHKFFALIGHSIIFFIAILNGASIFLFDAVFNSLHGTRPQDEHMRFVLAVGAGAGLLWLVIFFGKLP